MKFAVAFIAIVAIVILAICAMQFDAHTVFVIAIAMGLVAFFSGAAVTLGVFTRRLNANTKSSDDAELIRDPEGPSRFER